MSVMSASAAAQTMGVFDCSYPHHNADTDEPHKLYLVSNQQVLGQAGRKKRRNRLQNTVGAWTLEVKSVCIMRIKGGNEMVF